MSSANILIVDDEKDIRELVGEILADEGYRVETVDSGQHARLAVDESDFDLVLLDIWMPDVDGISLLKEWGQGGKLPFQVVMISGHGTVDTAVEATRLGAFDFVEKPLSTAKLLKTVEQALADRANRRDTTTLKDRLPEVVEPVGVSAAMRDLREQLDRLSSSEPAVLIRGESGSGKSTLARYLHAHSPRRQKRLVEVSGATLKANAERELFGFEDGDEVVSGKLEQAHGGTLFIDEVNELDTDLQRSLAAAIDTRSYRRVRGTENLPLDVRLICCTRADLEAEIRLGRFREDLYYQISVVPLVVPPLRERPEDVPELLSFYTDFFASRDKMPWRRFSVGAQNRLRNHHWGGNVHELRNLVQRLMLLGNGEEVGVDEIDQALAASGVAGSVSVPVRIYEMPLREAREQFEREYLEFQLRQVSGSVGRLAKNVGMERTHLYRKLRALGIDVRKTGQKG
ncbi:MAG: sigma-54-dependent Fis family transcriptional regulator [Lysobacteraceae bacterium]|nr:MAG: sigma-54-dependent Fis family transcriptional regulator [Xanthomonadaceae bacterium]